MQLPHEQQGAVAAAAAAASSCRLSVAAIVAAVARLVVVFRPPLLGALGIGRAAPARPGLDLGEGVGVRGGEGRDG